MQPLPVTAVWLCRQERERKRPPVGGQGAQGAPTVAPPDAAASDNGAARRCLRTFRRQRTWRCCAHPLPPLAEPLHPQTETGLRGAVCPAEP